MIPSSHSRPVAYCAVDSSSIWLSVACAELLVGRLVERAAGRLGGVAAHDGEDARQLLGPHHGDAVIGPGEDEAGVVGTAGHGVVARPVAGADHQREVRHRRVGDGVDQLGAVLDDPALLVAGAHHEAGDVLHEEDGGVGPVAQRDELGALLRLGREEDAVVGQHPEGVAAERRPAADQLGAVGLLELLEPRAVDNAGEDLAHVEGHPHVHRRDPEQLFGRIQRARRPERPVRAQGAASAGGPRCRVRCAAPRLRHVPGSRRAPRSAACIGAPPSSSSSASSPMAIFTRGGPPRKTRARSSTMTV